MVNATVKPNGGTVSDCHFEYGTSEAYGTSAPCTSLPGSGTSPVAVSAALASLSPAKTYHFRIAATNPNGTSRGSDQTFTTPTAPHYYSNKVLSSSQPRSVTSWGTLAFRTVVGGSGEVTCHTAVAGTIDNPEGGGPGVGSTELFATYRCESTTCPFTTFVAGEALPWPSLLEAAGSVIRAKTTGIKLQIECRKEGKLEHSDPFVGANAPSFQHGSSTLHPASLEFDAGSGTLERESSNDAIQSKPEGALVVLGYEEQEVINTSNP
jgi:hypothetical protein